MADMIFVETTDFYVKLRLALYDTHPEYFPEGTPVLEQRTGGTATTLASDGTADNFRSMDNPTLTALIAASKPSGYVVATKKLPDGAAEYVYTHIKWQSIINAAKEDRNRTLSAQSNPMEPVD